MGRTLPVATIAFLGFLLHAATGFTDEGVGEFGFRSRKVVLTNATVVVKPGERLDSATVVIEGSRIVAVGKDIPVPADARVIAVDGHFVYAGFVDAGTDRGLPAAQPTPMAGRTQPDRETSLASLPIDRAKGLTPEFRASEHVALSEADREAFRSAGFCAVRVLPTGRLMSGESALISTASLPRAEVVVPGGEAALLELRGLGGDGYPATLMGAFAHLRQAYLDAEAYAETWRRYEMLLINKQVTEFPPRVDPRLAAIARHRAELDHIFLANSIDDIDRVIAFKREILSSEEIPEQGAIWIRGAHEAGKRVDALKTHNLRVIQQVDFGEEPKLEPPKPKDDELPETVSPIEVRQQAHADWLERVRGLKTLHEGDVEFALSTIGSKSPTEALQSLRRAIREGLPADAALAALTTFAPDAGHNTVAPGSVASLVVMTGPFEEDFSKVRYCLVQGHVHEYNRTEKPKTKESKSDEEPATPSQIAGRWQVTVTTSGQPTRGELELIQRDAKLSGSFTSTSGDGLVESGRVQGNSVEWTVAIGAGAKTVSLVFTGKFEDGKLSGELKTPFGPPTPWSAERIEEQPADALNPIALGGIDEGKPEGSGDTPQLNEVEPVELDLHRRGTPASVEPGSLIVRRGTVLTATGETLVETDILIQDGRIAMIGKDLPAPADIREIDAAGRFVMPGVVDTHSHMMLVDVNESTDSIVCEVRMQDAIRTSDDNEYRNLATGMTTARLLHGSANCIGGQHAMVKLKIGATIADHLFPDTPVGVKFALGENVKFRTSRFPNTRLGVEATINRAFYEAADYRRVWNAYEQARMKGEVVEPPRRDLRLEALTQLLNQEIFIHSHCYRADEILMLLRVAETHGMRVWSLQHVLEGYKVAPEIARHGASCSTFADHWGYKVEAYDATPYNAWLLQQAGANVVIKSDFPVVRVPLTIEAAKTMRYGMSEASALQTITRNPSRELGIDEEVGTLEVGKMGDLAIFSGHPLNIFSRCEYTIIEGQVHFDRSHQPSAMTAAAVERSARPASVTLPGDGERPGRIDWPAVSERVALTNAVIHPVDSDEVIEGTLLVHGETIEALGKDIAIPDGTTAVDLGGLHVYPGLIDAGSLLGLTEIGKVRETQDFAESGEFQPDLIGGVAVNPDSEHLPIARFGGVLTAVTRPVSGRVAGQASFIQLDGWTVPEMTIDATAGLVVNWPAGKDRREPLKKLNEFFDEAARYRAAREAADEANRPGVDPRFEAMLPYLSGAKPVIFEAHSRMQIEEALEFIKTRSLKGIIGGGQDAWKLAKQLAEQKVSVIIDPVFQTPQEGYDPYDTTWANAGRLHDAGVAIAFRTDDAAHAHTLPFNAGRSVAFGLPESAALRALTLGPAEILGVDDRLGSLTPGKWATLIITDGSPLQPSTLVLGAMIRGRRISLETRHTRFAEKYRQRLAAP
ncbi:MAG: amidohydrolase family protein [Planctomycetaceae bacterium]|nr:amidohydrolase family protein [Planctomycetaceae bacterium]